MVSALGQNQFANVSTASQQQNDEQGRLSFEGAGVYVQKLGGDDGPGQTARLPEELSEDYSRFIEFLKTLPNGDYVVYFKRGGQSHEQAAARQAVVRVRVVNHRLNPDSGDFKPAGEVAEPPKNPDADTIPTTTTEAPSEQERAEIPAPSEMETLGEIPADSPAVIPAGGLGFARGGRVAGQPSRPPSPRQDMKTAPLTSINLWNSFRQNARLPGGEQIQVQIPMTK